MGVADAESESLSVKKTLKSDQSAESCRLGSEKGTSECS